MENKNSKFQGNKKEKGTHLRNGLFEYFKNGYFDISFPDIFKINFSEEKLKSDFNFKNYNFDLNLIKKTEPYYFLEIDRDKTRTKAIPHILSYIHFFKFLSKEEQLIFLKDDKNNLIGDKYLNSRPNYRNESLLFSYYGDYPIFSTNIKFSEKKYKEIKKYKKHYKNSQKLFGREDKKEEIELDVINFFPSIYTHKIYNNLDEKLDRKNQNKKFDDAVRSLNKNESNGLLIGPVSSLFFSEIILNQISFLLAKKNFIFKRFCDNFTFYFKNREEYEKNIFVIWEIFNKFNLNVKEKKEKRNISSFSKSAEEIIGKKMIDKILKEINSILCKKNEEYLWNGNYLITKIIKNKEIDWKININKKSELKKLIFNFISFPKLSNNIFILINKIIKNNEEKIKDEFIKNLENFELNKITNLFKSKQETKIIWFYYLKFYFVNEVKEEEINKAIKKCIKNKFYITASMIFFILKNNYDKDKKINNDLYQELGTIEIDFKRAEDVIFYLSFENILEMNIKEDKKKYIKIVDFLKEIEFNFFLFTNELRLNISSY